MGLFYSFFLKKTKYGDMLQSQIKENLNQDFNIHLNTLLKKNNINQSSLSKYELRRNIIFVFHGYIHDLMTHSSLI